MSEVAVPDRVLLLPDSLTLFVPGNTLRSEWTGKRRYVGAPGVERWRGQISIFPASTERQAQEIRRFVFGLRGQQNWFRWPLPCNNHVGAVPTVGADAGEDYELPVAGITPNARIVRGGGFMTVPLPSGHARAVVLMGDLRGDAAGEANATFEPALNETPAEGAEIETSRPYIPMALVDPEHALALAGGTTSATLAVEEAF